MRTIYTQGCILFLLLFALRGLGQTTLYLHSQATEKQDTDSSQIKNSAFTACYNVKNSIYCGFISSGVSYTFEIDATPSGHCAWWFLNGNYQGDDCSSTIEDPKWTQNFSSNSTFEANMYDNEPWSYSHNHKWYIYTSAPTVSLSASDITQTTAKVKWTSINGAYKYNVRYKKTNATTWTTINDISNTYYNITGLTYNTTYEWQLSVKCVECVNGNLSEANSSSWISSSTFKTIDFPDITIINSIVTPMSVHPGETIDVSCEQHLTNGTSTTMYPYVGYYLSTNTTCTTTSDTYLGNDQSSLSLSDTYDAESETLTIPSGTSPGTYYICFIGDYLNEVSESDESNNCGYIQITVEVYSTPIANFYASPTNGCAPLTVNFTNQSSDATSWSWNFGDGCTSTEQYPTHTFSNTGTYTVSLTATNACGNNSKSETITVNPCPIVNFSATPTSGCAPLTVNFTNQSSDATSWSWNFGDGCTSTEQYPTHTFSNTGTYTVSLTATNACGNNSKSETITVNPCPIVNFSATPTSGCAPLTVNFTNQSSDATNWSWDFGDSGSSTEKDPIHTYTTAGIYTVTLTATNAYGSNTKTLSNYISVENSPVSDFYATPTSGTAPLTVQFTNKSTNATSWTWDFGDGTNSNQKELSHTYYSIGVYTVTLIASNAYCDNTKEINNYIIVNSPTDVSSSEKSNLIRIYPNPTSGVLKIESSIEIYYLEIYDMVGQLVYESKLKPEINISKFNAGIYFIKLYIKNDMIHTKKIMLNK